MAEKLPTEELRNFFTSLAIENYCTKMYDYTVKFIKQNSHFDKR